MSAKSEKTSTEGLDRPERDSVYDFLYNDARRIASFLSQFDKDGHLTALVRTQGITESTGSNYGGTGGVTAHMLVNLNANAGRNVSESGSDSSSKTYDPIWQNSLALLDYLAQRNLVGRDLSQVKLGQFALVSGKLIITSIAMIRAVITSKRGATAMARSIQDSETKREKEQGKPVKSHREKEMEFKMTAEMIQGMFESIPSAVVMHLIGEEFSVWSSLGEDGLSVTIDDLLLKHGGTAAGDWNVLGIVDALPNAEPLAVDPYYQDDSAGSAIATLFTSLRPKMGRPDKAFGMTPLMIFREVAGY
jgi:hypothetical protein